MSVDFGTWGSAITQLNPSRGLRLGVMVGALAAGLGASASSPSLAQQSMQAHFGNMTYRLFCVGCHGADGSGNAAVARALGLTEVDLTTIRSRNDGTFPTEDVKASIIGLDGKGHARVTMAPWVAMFADEFEAFASKVVVDELVDRRIDHLVSYIESIQAD